MANKKSDKRIEFTITLNYNSWFEKGREPKNKADWEQWLFENFMPESLLVGTDDGEYQDMIDIQEVSITVNKLS